MTVKIEPFKIEPCLNCGSLNDGIMGIGNPDQPRPNEGDVTICMHCGHIMAFGKDLKLQELTDAQMIMVAGDPVIVAIQKARMKMQSKRPSDPPKKI